MKNQFSYKLFIISVITLVFSILFYKTNFQKKPVMHCDEREHHINQSMYYSIGIFGKYFSNLLTTFPGPFLISGLYIKLMGHDKLIENPKEINLMGNKPLKKEINEIASQKLFYKKIVYIPENFRGIDGVVAFESVDGIFYLIYSTLKGSIISYNFVANQIINEIKIASQYPFSIFRHYSDIKNHRDLLLCQPEIYMDIKIFEIKNF